MPKRLKLYRVYFHRVQNGWAILWGFSKENARERAMNYKNWMGEFYQEQNLNIQEAIEIKK